MDLTSHILSILLAIICFASAYADFTLKPQVVESLTHLKVPIRIMPALGIAKIAGALGLLIGFSNDGLRVYAALCLSIYFLLAIWFHLRVRDTLKGTAPAMVLCALSIATLITSL